MMNSVEHLEGEIIQTAKLAKNLAIISFVALGCSVLTGLASGSIIGTLIRAAISYFFANLNLKYSRELNKFVDSGNPLDLNQAVAAYRSYWAGCRDLAMIALGLLLFGLLILGGIMLMSSSAF